MTRPPLFSALRIAGIYTLLGALWIIASDRLLALIVPDLHALTMIQTYKGWGFVLASGLLIFLLLHRELGVRTAAEELLKESEARIRTKLDSILLPEGDIGTLELADVVDIPAFQALMDDFFSLSKIPVGLIDLKGKVLAATGWQEICTKFHRVHPETCQYCIESDTRLSGGAEPGSAKLYRCKNNMWDIAMPIVVGSEHLGNLFLGQFFLRTKSPITRYSGLRPVITDSTSTNTSQHLKKSLVGAGKL